MLLNTRPATAWVLSSAHHGSYWAKVRCLRLVYGVVFNGSLGSFNRVFLLRFDSGAEAVVRIPMQLYGDIERVTASEVSIMYYVRERWMYRRDSTGLRIGFPPKVISWNTKYSNPAQTRTMCPPIYSLAPDQRRRFFSRCAEHAYWVSKLGCSMGKRSPAAALYTLQRMLNDECAPVELNRRLAAKYTTANREWGRPGTMCAFLFFMHGASLTY